jgi:hypothetical protein
VKLNRAVFSFNQALAGVGIELSRVRLVRHQERGASGLTPYDLWVKDVVLFDNFQSKQASKDRTKFGGRLPAVIWASFVVPPTGLTLFVGLYDATFEGLLEKDETHEITLRPEVRGTKDRYSLSRRIELNDYAGRLFVEWGKGHRAWVQRASLQDKPVVELRRLPFEPVFPGLLSFRDIVSKIPALPASWRTPLAATKGIYLLACPQTGRQYVGSATGENGFLGRWLDYYRTSDGGNVELRGIDTAGYSCSILEVAGSGQTADEIGRREAVWKEKLHSRTLGHNRN